ncbi:hypothetical protein, partial [Pontibacter silvestris]|uniref:hypothetical protein n=1 Tax=Pontibacter silvestris TaxID=2305183 RepID=UPI001E524074
YHYSYRSTKLCNKTYAATLLNLKSKHRKKSCFNIILITLKYLQAGDIILTIVNSSNNQYDDKGPESKALCSKHLTVFISYRS